MRKTVKLLLAMSFVTLTWTMSAADGAHHKDGYTFRNGKVVLFKEGRETPVTAEVTFRNGSRLLPDGFIVFKDGRRERFVEDRWIDLDGEYVVVDAGIDDFDGYYLEGGRVYVIRDRRPVLVTVEVTLNDGSRLSPDGTIILKSGTRSRLTEGQRLSREGKIVEHRGTATTRTAESREKPIDTSRKIEDTNAAKTRQVEEHTRTATPERREEVKASERREEAVKGRQTEEKATEKREEIKREEKREEKK
jgi:hypothetical protein